MTRHIFIGDIQGCLGELESLLAALKFDPTSDILHPVGDLVNRGPNSLGTLRLLSSLNAQAVLGNHDLHLLRVASGSRKLSARDTFQDVLKAPDREDLLRYLRALPFARKLGDVLMVHAGIHPMWTDPLARLQGQDPLHPNPDIDFVTRVRLCNSEGFRPKENEADAGPEFKPWHQLLPIEAHRTIVFGHWAAQGLFVRPGFRGLDTGCVWGKALTAWISEEDRLVQVPAARVYCKHH